MTDFRKNGAGKASSQGHTLQNLTDTDLHGNWCL